MLFVKVLACFFVKKRCTYVYTKKFFFCFSKIETKMPIFVSGSVKPRFNDKDNERHKCSGNVEVFYEDQWFPVSKADLDNKETQKTICMELKCGDGLDSKAYFGPRPTMSNVVKVQECSQNTIAKCKVVTFESNSQISDPGGLHCSS